MCCPHCLSSFTSTRKHPTSPGHRTFSCSDRPKRYNERTVSPFNDLQSPTDIVLLAVLSHPRLKLGFRDVVGLLLQHGYRVSYQSIRFWKFRFAPLISDRLRARRRGRAGRSWYLDETYSRVGGRWRYLVEP